MDVNKQAFDKCYIILHNSLNVQRIVPNLMKKGLLTQDDKKRLNDPDTIDYEKVEYLAKILPRKGDHWLDKFLECLTETSEGTGHCKIVKELKHAKNELAKQEVDVEKTRNGISNKESDGDDCIIVHEGFPSPTGKDFGSNTCSEMGRPRRHYSDSDGIKAQAKSRKQLNKVEITVDQLKESYELHYSGKIQIKSQVDITDLDDPKYKVLIQTVNSNEFYAVMMQLKDHKATKYIGHDQVCSSFSYYYVGEWGTIPVVIVQTGMSSNGVNCSWYETKKALHFMRHLKYVFSVGVCGGVKGKVNLCDVIISKAIHGYGDLKITQFGWRNRSPYTLCSQMEIGYCLTRADNVSSNYNVKSGVVLSGPWLIADAKSQGDLLKISPEAIAFEMEGANIVQACGRTNVECLVVKGVSDLADYAKSDDWQPQAAKNAAEYLKEQMNNASHMFEGKNEAISKFIFYIKKATSFSQHYILNNKFYAGLIFVVILAFVVGVAFYNPSC